MVKYKTQFCLDFLLNKDSENNPTVTVYADQVNNLLVKRQYASRGRS